jgi:hypothetical protein
MLENVKQTVALDKARLNPEEIVKSKQLKQAADEITRKLAEADNSTAQALNKLRSGECMAN